MRRRRGPFSGQAIRRRCPDGRHLLLPIRDLPDGSGRAVASLIVKTRRPSRSRDALADVMAEQWRDVSPEVGCRCSHAGPAAGQRGGAAAGAPTDGAAGDIAQVLVHRHAVRAYQLHHLAGQGQDHLPRPAHACRCWRGAGCCWSMMSSAPAPRLLAVLRLLEKAGIVPAGIAVAMEQGTAWRGVLPDAALVRGAIRSPILRKAPEGYLAIP